MIRRLAIAMLLALTFLTLGAEIDGRDDLNATTEMEMK